MEDSPWLIRVMDGFRPPRLISDLTNVTVSYIIRVTMKVRRCRVCGKTFEAQRKSALYCSDACRQRAFRIRGGRDDRQDKRAKRR
jgi:hypothetical protein